MKLDSPLRPWPCSLWETVSLIWERIKLVWGNKDKLKGTRKLTGNVWYADKQQAVDHRLAPAPLNNILPLICQIPTSDAFRTCLAPWEKLFPCSQTETMRPLNSRARKGHCVVFTTVTALNLSVQNHRTKVLLLDFNRDIGLKVLKVFGLFWKLGTGWKLGLNPTPWGVLPNRVTLTVWLSWSYQRDNKHLGGW